MVNNSGTTDSKRQLSEIDRKNLKDFQTALHGILDKYEVSIIPVITLGPNGVLAASCTAVPDASRKRIVVPEINAGKVRKKMGGGG